MFNASRIVDSLNINDPRDVAQAYRIVADLLADGWLAVHVEQFIKLTEHVSPDLDECYALAEMSKLASLYPGSCTIKRAFWTVG